MLQVSRGNQFTGFSSPEESQPSCLCSLICLVTFQEGVLEGLWFSFKAVVEQYWEAQNPLKIIITHGEHLS